MSNGVLVKLELAALGALALVGGGVAWSAGPRGSEV